MVKVWCVNNTDATIFSSGPFKSHLRNQKRTDTIRCLSFFSLRFWDLNLTAFGKKARPLPLAASDGKITDDEEYTVGDYKFTFTGSLESCSCTVEESGEAAKDEYKVEVSDKGIVSVTKEEKATEATT